MPASSRDRGEASAALLPLHDLGERDSNDSHSDSGFTYRDSRGHAFNAFDRHAPQSWRARLLWLASLLLSFLPGQQHKRPSPRLGFSGRPTSWSWKRDFPLWALVALVSSIVFCGIFVPSYTHEPAHYVALRQRVLASKEPGRANLHGETVFIAASIFDKDGSLARGAWGRNVLQLIDILGPSNVFLSLYENDASAEAAQALSEFKAKLTCDHAVVNEPVNRTAISRVVLPDGLTVLKRVSFLSVVRNKALEPLNAQDSPVRDLAFDRLLYLNDVVFDPVDAANLLLSTNTQPGGLAKYRAACAIDFTNAFKFYDTFAARDLEGYGMGVPFYPWFSTAGRAESRNDVLSQTDAVRVRSCWGGMTAFDAKYFRTPEKTSKVKQPWDKYLPVQFRAEEEPFWDASECCLVHADIQYVDPGDLKVDTGIYMNPYIRTAYTTRTLSWLRFTRRFERMYTFVQRIVNYIGRLPTYNPRRREPPDGVKSGPAWVYIESQQAWGWKDSVRDLKPGGFCGSVRLLALPDDGTGANWWTEFPPTREER